MEQGMESYMNMFRHIKHRRFGKMKCPDCGKELKKPVKEWDLSPKVHVKLYDCCGKKVREYIRK
ncbi:MAG: hypothetical protein QXR63_02995 [Candidatus Bathyarchaeia archaeon]